MGGDRGGVVVVASIVRAGVTKSEAREVEATEEVEEDSGVAKAGKGCESSVMINRSSQ